VVVRGGEGGEVAESVQGDGVLWGRETDGSGVSGNVARGDIVRSLGSDEETVTAEDSVGGEGGALTCQRALSGV
jgi:hypothetical protein